MGIPTAWPSSPSTAWKHCSASLGVDTASPQRAQLMWLPGKAGRQGTAQPYLSQTLAVPLPVQSAGAPRVLPFMPALEQFHTVTYNLHTAQPRFRASHPHLQFYTTLLVPGTHTQYCSSPHLNVQHPNMSFYSTEFQHQACLTGCQPCLCVPGTQPLPPSTHTSEVHIPACQPRDQCSQDW